MFLKEHWSVWYLDSSFIASDLDSCVKKEKDKKIVEIAKRASGLGGKEQRTGDV